MCEGTLGVVLDVDRLRRERFELIGELSVRCELPGARSVDGTLSIADFNLSSARARSERAKLLADRGNAPELDWHAIVEEFCQRVLQEDRVGQPAVDLRQLPKPSQDGDLNVEGLVFPRSHPTILFGDGGSAKSYLALFLAGRMAQQGRRVALFDWELAGEDHRERLELLFPGSMPQILYARCERPLVHDVDRLRRVVRDNGVEYCVFDSVAFACDGPPEAAEVAGRYFRAARQIGGGGLHIAHINKSENADQKPFGSTFWHNGARSSWFVEKSEESTDGDILKIGLFNRKSNLGRLRPPAGFTIRFTEDRTTFQRCDPADSPDLAKRLSIKQRMLALLQKGSWTAGQIAEELDEELKSVQRAIQRDKKLFLMLPGGKIGLMTRMAENG